MTVGTLDYDRWEIKIEVGTLSEERYRLRSCQREPDTVAFLESLADGSVFFDIGANVGAYSLVAAAQNFLDRKGVTVWAFEPAWVNYESLLRNIRVNRFETVITPVNISLSDRTGTGRLNWGGEVSMPESGSSGFQLDRAVDWEGRHFDVSAQHNVLSITVDEFVRSFGVIPNAMKVDVDGLEGEILKGARGILAESALHSVLVEINPDHDEALFPLLESYGFEGQRHSAHNNYLFRR